MQIAFNTASLVARVTDYRYRLSDWGKQDGLTSHAMTAETWDSICAEIAAAGFSAIELWSAHVRAGALSATEAVVWQEILGHHGLKVIAYGGTPSPAAAGICKFLGVDLLNGGLWATTIKDVEAVCRSLDVRFNFENHAEKNEDEILAVIRGGNEFVGVCLDTGWCGTQGMKIGAAIRKLGPLLRHVHLKDVRAEGSHDTCPPGEGVVRLDEVFDALGEVGYAGYLSWEDQPESRNPLHSAPAARRWIETQLAA